MIKNVPFSQLLQHNDESQEDWLVRLLSHTEGEEEDDESGNGEPLQVNEAEHDGGAEEPPNPQLLKKDDESHEEWLVRVLSHTESDDDDDGSSDGEPLPKKPKVNDAVVNEPVVESVFVVMDAVQLEEAEVVPVGPLIASVPEWLHCDDCNQACKGQHGLRIHKKSCAQLHQFPCSSCEKIFRSQAALDGHSKVHRNTNNTQGVLRTRPHQEVTRLATFLPDPSPEVELDDADQERESGPEEAADVLQMPQAFVFIEAFVSTGDDFLIDMPTDNDNDIANVMLFDNDNDNENDEDIDEEEEEIEDDRAAPVVRKTSKPRLPLQVRTVIDNYLKAYRVDVSPRIAGRGLGLNVERETIKKYIDYARRLLMYVASEETTNEEVMLAALASTDMDALISSTTENVTTGMTVLKYATRFSSFMTFTGIDTALWQPAAKEVKGRGSVKQKKDTNINRAVHGMRGRAGMFLQAFRVRVRLFLSETIEFHSTVGVPLSRDSLDQIRVNADTMPSKPKRAQRRKFHALNFTLT